MPLAVFEPIFLCLRDTICDVENSGMMTTRKVWQIKVASFLCISSTRLRISAWPPTAEDERAKVSFYWLCGEKEVPPNPVLIPVP